MKQNSRELKGKIHNSTVIVGDFNALPSIMDRTGHIINKEIRRLKQHHKQPELTDIYRTFHSTINILLKCIFSSTDYMLGHRTILNNLKSTEIIQNMFSKHNRMEWNQKCTLKGNLENSQLHQLKNKYNEITRKIIKYLEMNKNETIKTYGMQLTLHLTK